jgi:hypothetical protein
VAVGGPGGGGGGGTGGGGGGPPLHTAALWLGLPGVSIPHGTHEQAPPPKLSNSQQPFCAWVSQAPVHCASVQCCSSALRCPGTVRLGAHAPRRVNSPQLTAEGRRSSDPSAPSPEMRSSAAAVTFAPIATACRRARPAPRPSVRRESSSLYSIRRSAQVDFEFSMMKVHHE